MSPSYPIGIFGGTFDPIHYGHLRAACEILNIIQLGEIRFLPCGNPSHRKLTLADSETRLRMVNAAIKEHKNFVIDDREVRRKELSYSIDTLTSLREDYRDISLCLIIGMDAFICLHKWHRWEEILNFSHIIVVDRPGCNLPNSGLLNNLIRDKGTKNIRKLHDLTHGFIYVQAVTQMDIASTKIRELATKGINLQFLVPEAVIDIIKEENLYMSEMNE